MSPSPDPIVEMPEGAGSGIRGYHAIEPHLIIDTPLFVKAFGVR